MTFENNYWDSIPNDIPCKPALPCRTDIAVIGAGYTGLSVALHLARAGRDVTVFEAGEIGAGCSSRNGGMAGPSFHKLGSAGLLSRYGEQKTLNIMREGLLAFSYFEEFVQQENLDCDLQMRGRFRGARTVADYESTARECTWLGKNLGLSFDMVPQTGQRAEIGSDFYRGGVVYHRDGNIHPRKLVLELARIAAAEGVRIITNCPVTHLRHDDKKTALNTRLGTVEASEVVMATNAYSNSGAKAMKRRVVQIRTAAVATEQLPPQLMAELSPKGRSFGESGRVFMWFRPTPDGKRFIFGGRIGTPGGNSDVQRKAFAASATRVFPQLKNVAFSHVWSGDVAYTTDHSPHIGFEDGVWLAGGYCGSGVTRSIYFGMKLARKILGEPDSETAFDDLPFAPVPFKLFSGPVAGLLTKWYAHQDARDLLRR
ncbi:MAG: NAD(P)/FAD-dependent oxidoreductase [Sulfitobacter sp.]